MRHDQAIETMAAERYLLDEMSEIERYRFEEHFFDCEECAEAMRLGHRLREDARAIFPEEAPLVAEKPAPSEAGRSWPRVAIPWAAAAVLTLALGYQVSLPDRPALEEQAFAPVALRAMSRGELPVVTLPSDGIVPLSFDLPSARPGEAIEYSLLRADGTEVMRGRSTAPASGTALVWPVSADRLRPGGRFLVRATLPGDGTAPPAEFPFLAHAP